MIDLVNTADPTDLEFSPAVLLSQLVSGDGRMNESIGLTPIHTVFHREHDFQVDRIADLAAARPDAEQWTPSVIFNKFADVPPAAFRTAGSTA